MMCPSHPKTIPTRPCLWKNCFPQNRSLAPERLGPAALKAYLHVWTMMPEGVFFGRGSSSAPHKRTGPRRSLRGPTGNFVSTRLATGAQVKQFLGLCEGVSGELSSGTGGLPSAGGPPRAGAPPPCGWAHPPAEGLDRTEGGGRRDLPFCTCLRVKLASSHLLSPGPQAPGLGVTHTTCFLGPQAANSSSWDFSASVITGAKASQ